MPSLKLYYFDTAGRGECTRLALAHGKIPYEDIRIPRDEWVTKYKPMSPTGQVPMLEVDGKKYVESLAMFNYACRLAKLVPECPILELKCRQLIFQSEAIFGCVGKMMRAKPEDLDAIKKEVETESVAIAKQLDKFAEVKGTEGPIDMADVFALSLVIAAKIAFSRFQLQSPMEHARHFNKLADRARACPNIKAYLK